MKPNPGGTITGEAIVNREKEIKSIWRALQNQSVVVISERRVGKTSILRKMEENPKDGWNPINNRRTYKFRYAILKKWWKVNRG